MSCEPNNFTHLAKTGGKKVALGLLWQQKKVFPRKLALRVEIFGLIVPASSQGR
jgi:hypothetical protein